MPINPDWFKFIPEFILTAPRFMRRLINNEYEDWLTNELWGITEQGAQIPRELGTFSDDLGQSAIRATGYLRYLGESVHRTEYNPGGEDRFYINLYSRNSLPFHAVTRGMPLQSSYEDMDPSLVQTYFPNAQVGQETVNALSNALRSIPALTANEYDVSWWSQGYSGMMVFRGALTLPNPDTAILNHGAIYNYNGALSGDRIISVNSIVTNTDFMSTSAHPTVASEFVIRQAVSWSGGQGEVPGIVVDALYRRVMFRIDMLSGRNICPWTNLNQAEILFPLRSLFRVREITVGGYGLLVHLVELTPEEAARVTQAQNLLTGTIVRFR